MSIRSRSWGLAALLLGIGWAFLGPSARPGRAGDGGQPHLDFRPSYADAMLEARIRNLPILVSRHKDF